MSLQIFGSCSRITRNIILQLAKNNQYSKITVNDLLPVYSFHDRFYRLQRELADAKLTIDINLDKILQPSTLNQKVNSNDDVLFVTHDYYQHVASKTKLMTTIAQLAKNVPICFICIRRIISILPLQLNMITMDLPILPKITIMLSVKSDKQIQIRLSLDLIFKIKLSSLPITRAPRISLKTNS